ncbi:hexokinase-1 [Selaginella moellendorffii]|uniref:hexokinase-1 n=1 Tax=Selaginella moellendorffii TaxID=88036 RepID=UPI000D1CC7B2|nr:hexokinase-1 [Selaginella moellendorffii]|eukprot:XP_024533280.1 hexokinase-1 [Selaginella moellendorffii]
MATTHLYSLGCVSVYELKGLVLVYMVWFIDIHNWAISVRKDETTKRKQRQRVWRVMGLLDTDAWLMLYEGVAASWPTLEEREVVENVGKAGVAVALFVCTALSCAVAAMVVNKQMQKNVNWGRVQATIKEFRDGCATPLQRLQKLAADMHKEMIAGLAKDGGSKLKMLLSFVEKLPSGNESGLFYGLDLGGTNFRVLRVQLGGKDKRIVKQEYEVVSIPPRLMIGSNEDLFDYIAQVLAKFVAKEGNDCKLAPGHKRELGFTFSFPVSQQSIDSGTLVKWTKGFAIAETVGKDVVKELQAAMMRQKMDMRVAALVNDTTGTLAGGRYRNDDVMMGLILGTGSNACYVEQTSAIPKWPPGLPKPEITVINMEWGNFWSSHLPKTKVDDDLDADSVNPGDQAFEKLFSGMYLGDIVRRVILKLAQDACLFGGSIPKNLTSPFVLRTPDVSCMHADESADLKEVAKVIKAAFGVRSLPVETRKVIIEICDIAAQRGARLVAAGIVGILRKIGREGKDVRTVVGMDGGLYEHYPKFRGCLHEALGELLGKEGSANVVIELSKDGSGLGAALLAASHSVALQKA